MKVGTRLYLAVLPAVLGVVLVAALAYWGRRNYQVPEAFVPIAVVASVASLVLVWRNSRYVTQRIEHLAGQPARSTPGDELDRIEAAVEGLNSEIASERVAAEGRLSAAEAYAAELERLVQQTLEAAQSRLGDVQLPLHILLSSPFGELNENQEEILVAAQQAVDTADIELRRIRKLVDVGAGLVSFLPRPIAVRELLRPPLAIAAARAEASHGRVVSDVADTLPRVIVDAPHTQEAMTAILSHAAARIKPGGEIIVTASESRDGQVTIRTAPGATHDFDPASLDLELRLCSRILEAQGGDVTFSATETVVALPTERQLAGQG